MPHVSTRSSKVVSKPFAEVAQLASQVDPTHDLNALRLWVCRVVATRMASSAGLTPTQDSGLWSRDLGRGNTVDAGLIEGLEDRIARAVLDDDASIASGDPIGSFYQASLLWRRTESRTKVIDTSGGGARRRAGAFYTPPALVAFMLDRTLGTQPGAAPVVCDPSCGSGACLIAAARRLTTGNRARLRDVLRRQIRGVEFDPVAAAIARTRLWLELADAEIPLSAFDAVVRTGNGLAGYAREAPEDADTRCAAYFDPRAGDDETLAQDIARRERFLHWPHAFGDVFAGSNEQRDSEDNEHHRGFDVIIGNPPFLNQLSSRTAASRAHAALLCETTGGAVRGYTDRAAAFLLRSAQLLKPGGVMALVQPESTLTARDAAPVREYLGKQGAIETLWIEHPRGASTLFGVGVRPAVIGFRKATDSTNPSDPTASRERTARFASATFERAPDFRHTEAQRDMPQRSWAPMVAALRGVPPLTLEGHGVIGDLAEATADFRDEYYALRDAVVEAYDAPAGSPRVVTSGLIDPAELLWGAAPARLHREAWTRPCARLEAMPQDAKTQRWLARRLTPKLLVATQTPVLEVVADALGGLLPVTPVLIVTPRAVGHEAELWRVGALLASPVLSVVAATRHGGAGMSSDALKLRAAELADLPVPNASHAWDAARDAFKAASRAPDREHRLEALRRLGEQSLEAYAVPIGERDAVMAWWWSRLTRPRRGIAARTMQSHEPAQ
ncbi:MAG: N-6 DNA methylase [Planctomycetota bacterium]